MPWYEVDTMTLRYEFVQLARHAGANISDLCRRFRISRKTGYKWLARMVQAEAGLEAGLRLDASLLADHSRRPLTSPARTPEEIETRVCQLRQAQPAWGGRKIARVLQDDGLADAPAPSTVTEILRRHGLLDPADAPKHTAWTRFEAAGPNALWQMDFKGHHPTAAGRCHPLTVLDDYSRFNLVLQACANETTATVQTALIAAFERYGLPEAILTDNGPPWGDGAHSPYTRLGVWLLRLGIRIRHGRPYHPQTQGKEERFHRTLTAEVLQRQTFADLPACQRAYDAWREIYNLIRPHEALDLRPPISRYAPSPYPYPGSCPPIEYGPEDAVRRVQADGTFAFHGRVGKVAKAFVAQPVAVRPVDAQGHFAVYFCRQCIGQFLLTDLPRAH